MLCMQFSVALVRFSLGDQVQAIAVVYVLVSCLAMICLSQQSCSLAALSFAWFGEAHMAVLVCMQ